MGNPIKIIIVDDHPLIREGIKQILSFSEDISIVGEGCNGQEALALQVNGYILKDSAGTTLIDAIKHIHAGNVFIDQSLNKHIFHLVQEASSTGSITSEPSPDTSVLDSSNPLSLNELSDRQKAILYLISRGLSNKEIASQLFLSEKTIRNNITLLFKKINVKDRVQATQFVLNAGKKII